jgi:hypothetical protein
LSCKYCYIVETNSISTGRARLEYGEGKHSKHKDFN